MNEALATAILGFLSLLVTGVIANLFSRLSRLERRVDALQTSLDIWKTNYAVIRSNVAQFVRNTRGTIPTNTQLDELDAHKTVMQLEADVLEAIQRRS